MVMGKEGKEGADKMQPREEITPRLKRLSEQGIRVKNRFRRKDNEFIFTISGFHVQSCM